MKNPVGPKPHGFSVLVVEDDTRLGRAYRRGLRKAGATSVEVARTLAEGMAWLAAERFDVCWLDLGLPDGRGVDLVEPARRASPFAVIVVVSSAAEDDELHRLGWEQIPYFDRVRTPFEHVVATLLARLELTRTLAAREAARLKLELLRFEHDLLARALDEHAGNVTATARDLGITREALQHRAKRARVLPRAVLK